MWGIQGPALKEPVQEINLSPRYPRCVDPSPHSCQQSRCWSKHHLRWKEKRQHFEGFVLNIIFSTFKEDRIFQRSFIFSLTHF